MDPTDAKHLLTAGQASTRPPTGRAPTGRRSTTSARGPDDTPNKVSAVDLRGDFTGASTGGPAGAADRDFDWAGGTDTVPGADASTQLETPGTFTDNAFTIKPGESNLEATITVTWANDTDDWDMRVLKGDEVVGESLSTGGSGHSEQVSLTAPKPGDYTIRVYNYAAPLAPASTAPRASRRRSGPTSPATARRPTSATAATATRWPRGRSGAGWRRTWAAPSRPSGSRATAGTTPPPTGCPTATSPRFRWTRPIRARSTSRSAATRAAGSRSTRSARTRRTSAPGTCSSPPTRARRSATSRATCPTRPRSGPSCATGS